MAAMVQQATTAPHTAENGKWNVNFQSKWSPSEYFGQWPNHTYFPSPTDWRALSVYQLLTDRFADGDPRNNELQAGGFDVRDLTFRHGGDFKGLTAKLPYIKGLGCDAIWISPIFQNAFNEYHQYSMLDFTVIDRRLGTLEDLRNLTDAAHKLGMYVLIDVVMNHMDNQYYFFGDEYVASPFRYHGNSSQATPREYQYIPRDASQLLETPAGKQAYADFWVNNTFVPDAQYPGTLYGQYGESYTDLGRGTYDYSDFHHNGDLLDYFDIRQINYGKIYGSQDDLRLEHPRVQAKYIAMTKALIASVDCDGFRVDTPMQVPLAFYKAWAPAIRDYAKSLGKKDFGMFGEFFVTTERYATMMGRGRDNTMYGQNRFIDGAATLKGGIDYPYYWYTFTAMVYNQPQYAYGHALSYQKENTMIDTFDPMTNRSEYAMWNFCNNHDNWRLQSMSGFNQMRMCQAVITFWPGLPLHYAGDEQDFNTPGTALDGWAREELAASMAWSALSTLPSGNPANKDNFDMTHQTYRYVARLNALRKLFFGSFGSEECDNIWAPSPAVVNVLVFVRGCTQQSKIAVLANFHSSDVMPVTFSSPWGQGIVVQDALASSNALQLMVGLNGVVTTTLRPLQVLVLVPLSMLGAVPPQVVSVFPPHGGVAQWSSSTANVTLQFDRVMQANVVSSALLDGQKANFTCAASGCQQITVFFDSSRLTSGIHTIDVLSASDLNGLALIAPFRSFFMVNRAGSMGMLADVQTHSRPGMICEGNTKICHKAAGAARFRIRNVDGNWTDWQDYKEQTAWNATPGVGVVVQYNTEGSSSYIAGDCVAYNGKRCLVSYHSSMFLRGDWSGFAAPSSTRMALVKDFTWGMNLTVDTYKQGKFTPSTSWATAYGQMPESKLLYSLPSWDPGFKTFTNVPLLSGTSAVQRWMMARGQWSEHQSIATGASFATNIWVSPLCTAVAPTCDPTVSKTWKPYGFTSGQNQAWCNTAGVVGCFEYAENNGSASMASCGSFSCCIRAVDVMPVWKNTTCCVLFNDLTLSYTVTPNLTQCVAPVVTVPLKLTKSLASASTASQSLATAANPQVQDPVTWGSSQVTAAQRRFDDTKWKRHPSPADWHSEVVYTITVDRFANVDLNNDDLNLPSFQNDEMSSGQPLNLYQWRHGGDLQGVMSRLTYLQEIGVTVISLSPVFFSSGGEYHGFCTTDLSSIDPGFGSESLLQELVRSAHLLGIRVLMEVQVNHVCDSGLTFEASGAQSEVDRVTACVADMEAAYYATTPQQPEAEENRLNISFGSSVPKFLQHQEFFTRCGDPSFFRPDGMDYRKDPRAYQAAMLWTNIFGSNHVELDTLNVDFQKLYTSLLKYWIAVADIDGYRISSAAYVSADFTAYLSSNLRFYAKSLGKDNFFMVGEVAQATTPLGSQYVGTVQDALGPATLPARVQVAIEETCPLYSATQNALFPGFSSTYPSQEASYVKTIAEGNALGPQFFMQPEWQAPIIQSQQANDQGDILSSLTAVESRDSGRLLAQGSGDVWRLEVALLWSFTWYGIPEIYNGMEMGFNGLCYKTAANRKSLIDTLTSSGVSAKVASSLMSACDYASLNFNTGFSSQDMFSGGPMRLGSAIASVDKQFHLGTRLMSAAAPHWCEEPLLDRSNEVYSLLKTLIRIRRSCSSLRSNLYEQATVIAGDTNQLAYWKLHNNDSSTASSQAFLVVLNFEPFSSKATLKYLVPPGVTFSDGDLLTDMLNPSRNGIVSVQGNQTTFIVSQVWNAPHMSIFAPSGLVKLDGSSPWLVCKGTDLGSSKASICIPKPQIATWCCLCFWLAIPALVLIVNYQSSIYISVVKGATAPSIGGTPGAKVAARHILTAAIEHTIPDRGVKVSAGGLGKVLDQMLLEHPHGVLSLIHPMFGDVDYGPLEEYTRLTIVVDSQMHEVIVYTFSSEKNGIQRDWYLLSSKMFLERSKASPYPCPMTKLSVLRYFSLWNQAVGILISELQPDVYHCMDYHASIAPLYMPRKKQVPMILVLHNADYMGVIETDFISDRFWKTVPQLRRLALVFNLKTETIREYCCFEGRFNMLQAAVTFIRQNQGGRGVCAVSENYGVELKREKTLFAGLHCILNLDNATDPAKDAGEASVELLKAARVKSKALLQQRCGLKEDPDAKILIFIGRWVKQKGVDLIAMLTPAFLESHPEAQIVLAGPPGDACGLYASSLLEPMKEKFPGRLFVCTEFFRLEEDLRRGAHLCFAPSCSEPFGYVDVEFGLLGVPSVGCAIGGLGKMPGVYFRQQNSDDAKSLAASFFCAVDFSLNLPDADYWEMAHAATKATFPFDTWRENLTEAYSQALINFCPDTSGEELSLNHLWVRSSEGCEIKAALGGNREGWRKAFRRLCFRNASSAAADVMHQMRVLDVDDAAEFLTQGVSEERTHDIMRVSMKSGMVSDSEQLQGDICLAEQRLNERSAVTIWLMKSFLGGLCLRIHVVIAMGYIFSPVGETLLKELEVQAKESSFATPQVLWVTFYAGAAVGCVLWFLLSRGIPPNYLMAIAQLSNIVFFVIVPSLPGNFFASDAATVIYLGLCGLQSSSRLLYIIWNFNEDFRGGFQVAAGRIGALESMRTGVAWLAVSLSYAGASWVNKGIVAVVAIFCSTLLFMAPRCYTSCVLPFTKPLEGLTRKTFLLLILSEIFNSLANYQTQTYTVWWTLNGWEPREILTFALVVGLLSPVIISGSFATLSWMNVWGPWPMRDFTCFIPPGALLRAIALLDLGFLHYRSTLFVAAIVASVLVDVARSAAVWSSMMTVLGNKWYALKGCYFVLGLVSICACVSPYLGSLIAQVATGRNVLSADPSFDPPVDGSSSYNQAIAWAVIPLACMSYIFQLIASRYFNCDILTYKGHGNLLPDGTRTGTSSVQHRISAREMQRLASQATAETEDAEVPTLHHYTISWLHEKSKARVDPNPPAGLFSETSRPQSPAHAVAVLVATEELEESPVFGKKVEDLEAVTFKLSPRKSRRQRSPETPERSKSSASEAPFVPNIGASVVALGGSSSTDSIVTLATMNVGRSNVREDCGQASATSATSAL